MSIRIIKAGISDTVQDGGRYGFQHVGVNPGGVADQFAAAITNSLAGNDEEDAVIEFHFPAATLFFEHESLIAIGGADFAPAMNGEEIPLWHPIIVSKNSILQFTQKKQGARCYLAVREGLEINKWLNSYSTNLKAGAGGFNGRALVKDDVIQFRKKTDYKKYLQQKDSIVLPWKADAEWNKSPNKKIQVLRGNEWQYITEEAKHLFTARAFSITSASDRMGYRLDGPVLQNIIKHELLSAAVSFGTIQLLPDGRLIILMSDHQTTGGYPRLAHVISTDLPRLAQMNPGNDIRFSIADQKKAEDFLITQQQHLLQIKNACKLKLSAYLSS